MGSYEHINYSLRPAKHVERKMLVESFRKLSEFDAIRNYRYIGFGSIYFSDFHLLHKSLGITNMLSIEKDEHNQSRFEFNSPFDCVDIKFGMSDAILPTLEWENIPTIIWLDYDGKLKSG